MTLLLLTLYNVPSILFLVWVVVDDFRHRYISTWTLIAFLLCSFTKMFFLVGVDKFVLVNWGLSFCLVSIQLLVVKTYFGIIRQREIGDMIGLGDVLFLYAMVFTLPTLFFIVASLAAYLVALLVRVLVPRHFVTIPLAGWLASMLAVGQLIELIIKTSLWNCLYLL